MFSSTKIIFSVTLYLRSLTVLHLSFFYLMLFYCRFILILSNTFIVSFMGSFPISLFFFVFQFIVLILDQKKASLSVPIFLCYNCSENGNHDDFYTKLYCMLCMRRSSERIFEGSDLVSEFFYYYIFFRNVLF